MRPEIREWLTSEEGIAWLAGALAGWYLPKPWKTNDETKTILQNRADLREVIDYALSDPEWIERSALD